jgi:hypothetical protein
MAALSRQTLAEIRDEALKALGKSGNTTISSRCEYWLAAALEQLGTEWYHHELVVVDIASMDLAVGASTDTLPTDVWTVMQVGLIQSGTFQSWLAPEDLRNVYDQVGQAGNARPTAYARRDRDLVFDRTADAAYDVHLVYYKLPDVPDFAGSATSTLPRNWDHALICATVALGAERLGDADKLEQYNARLQQFLQAQQRPAMGATAMTDLAILPKRDAVLGGNS